MDPRALLQQVFYIVNQTTLKAYIIYFEKKNLIRLALKQRLWGNLS